MYTWFDRFSRWATAMMGSPWALIGFLAVTCVWFPLTRWLQWGDPWDKYTALVTILTQVTAMLVLYAQRVEERGMQLKLDELIRAIEGADNALRGVEKHPLRP